MRNKQDTAVSPDITSLRRSPIGIFLFPENPLSSSGRLPSIRPYFILIQGKMREYGRKKAVQLLRAPQKDKETGTTIHTKQQNCPLLIINC
jgi:hypothetical protein